MANYWIRENGQNTLSGVEGEEGNRPVLPDHLILEFLSDGNQKARDDFLKLLPLMSVTEKERLNVLWAYSMKPKKYPQQIEDSFQTSMNNLRINTQNNLPKTVNKSNPKSKLRVNQ